MSSNSRCPWPTAIGCTISRSSSNSPWASSQRAVVALPDMLISPSVCSLTSRSRAATWSVSPEIRVVFCQVASVSVVVSTYFGAALMNDAKPASSPPVWFGQYCAHWSYNRRPISSAVAFSTPRPMAAPISSSK
ncbi:hypothetical protein Dfulv_23525 [Dactylosporangium fulvum]|uniref:Uncharacterized protein n=1 Tax=Dactylosporangium fulvum TaxID=53359 RepID=A0ABY5WCD8_9ACTN|nr:hypothetical protein [Dactylosporangium fulvum]UWP87050.1 hypothetical protein Dfulv_23525 [Dactylosporangium fulvum]